MTTEEMIESLKPSVLLLRLPGGTGTGFLISERGHLLTCNHVVLGEMVTVQSCTGKVWAVGVLARERACDLAVLQIEEPEARPLCFADPADIVEGQTVFALGHPMGLDFAVSRGIISSRDHVSKGVSYVKTDAALNPGSSGGPIINSRGEVIGIADWVVSQSQGFGFAVAVRYVLALAARLRIPVRRAVAFREAPPEAGAPGS